MIQKKTLTAEIIAQFFVDALQELAPAGLTLERQPGDAPSSSGLSGWYKLSFADPGFDLFVAVPAEAASALFPAAGKTPAPGVFLEKAAVEFAATLAEITGAAIRFSSIEEEDPPAGAPLLAFEYQQDGSAAIALSVPETAAGLLGSPARGSGKGARTSESGPPLDVLMGIDLPVTIRFGSMEIPLGEALKLTTGSIVELNHNLNDPIDVVVNKCVVARGEVVVIEGNYGIRVVEIVTQNLPA